MLGRLIKNRRRAARYPVRIPIRVSLAKDKANIGHAGSPPTMLGHTWDVSMDGLALIVPSLQINGRDLAELNSVLRLRLALPVGYVETDVILVRYEQFRKNEPGSGYLLGVKIKEISSSDRALYNRYVRTLR